jgi:hypothetical protein
VTVFQITPFTFPNNGHPYFGKTEKMEIKFQKPSPFFEKVKGVFSITVTVIKG